MFRFMVGASCFACVYHLSHVSSLTPVRLLTQFVHNNSRVFGYNSPGSLQLRDQERIMSSRRTMRSCRSRTYLTPEQPPWRSDRA